MTDRGRTRATNEDALVADAPVFAVADGMGGHAAGDVASWTALHAFIDLAQREYITKDDVVRTIANANSSILDEARKRPDRAGMGTTLSGVVFGTAAGSPHWIVFNVGDSRVYRLENDVLEQVTTDHSEVEELVVAGSITREQSRSHPSRNVVTRCLGSDPAPSADCWVFPPAARERFLVCSDGASGQIDFSQIRQTLRDVADPQDAAQELVNLALQAGGPDNITVIVVDAASDDRTDVTGERWAPRAI